MKLRPGTYNTVYYPSDSGDDAPLNVFCSGITHENPHFHTELLSLDNNSITYYQFEYVTEGKGYIEINGTTHTVVQGDLFIIGKGTPRILYSDKKQPLKKQFITANGLLVDGLMRSYKLTDPFLVAKTDASPYFLKIFSILGEAEEFTPEVSAKVAQELLKIIQSAYLYNLECTRQTVVDECTAENIMKYIDMNIGRKFSIDEICASFFVGKTKLRAVFKKKYGITPMEYAQAKRVERAKYYLCNTVIPISSLHELIGMNDVKYFSKLFKTHTGMTPKKFRNKFYGNRNLTPSAISNWESVKASREGTDSPPCLKDSF